MMNSYIESMPTSTFKDRVTSVLNDLNRSKAWLAEEIGISRQALNYLLTNTNGGKYISHIAEALNINPEWLASGEGELNLATNHTNTIPLLKVESISPWLSGNFNDLYETIPVEYTETSRTFAVILDNSSMEIEFAKNSILIFKQSIKPLNGDFVLAQLTINNEDPIFIFRKYMTDGTGVYLKALDPTFRTITEDDQFEIIGSLIEQRRKFHY
jgi:SOS-response transcriptional repressor LexA